jgi:pimeloyl-ACP methyl ester carboxylesterase
MQFVFSRAFARSILFASFTVVLVARMAHAWAGPSGAQVNAAPDFVPPPIIFTNCEENEALECCTLTVPVDYRNPGGATTGIAVIRARATIPDRRIGVLIGNPGGPGFSGIDFILAGVHAPIFTALNSRFDILGFDPRGVARSGAVKCEVEPAGDPSELGPSERAAFFDELSARVANACLEQNGPFILTLSTNNAARDMDTLRRALGEEQISYAGVSAGTYLGAAYASMFPERVRAMILDSNVAPEFRDNYVEFNSEQAAAFELVFQHIDDLCAKNASCRLHDTGVVRALDELMARLAAHPVTSPGGIVLTDVEVRNVVADALYSELDWPGIIGALADALDGDYRFFFANAANATILIRLALDTTTFDSYDAMVCNDNGTRRPAADHLAVDDTRGKLFPRFFGPFYVSGEVARCAAWAPADLPVIRNVRGRLAAPILFYGNDFDPATPLSWTRSMARALGFERNIVRYEGGGHGVATNNNQCIDAITKDYFFDLRLPPEGTACPALLGAEAIARAVDVADEARWDWSSAAGVR